MTEPNQPEAEEERLIQVLLTPNQVLFVIFAVSAGVSAVEASVLKTIESVQRCIEAQQSLAVVVSKLPTEEMNCVVPALLTMLGEGEDLLHETLEDVLKRLGY